jgi:hypothetical protein
MSQSIEVVDLLEPKIKSLREEHESRTKFFNECTLSIKRLQNERKNALAAINQIAGAISAYSEVLRVSGAETPAEVEVIPAERD